MTPTERLAQVRHPAALRPVLVMGGALGLAAALVAAAPVVRTVAAGLLVLVTWAATAVAARRLDVARREGSELAGRARQQSQDRFQALVEHARDLIVVVELSGQVTYASPAAVHLLLLDPQASRGDDLYALVLEEDRPQLARSVESIFSGQVSQARSTARFHGRDGGVVWLDTVVTDLRDDPAVRGLVMNAHDVTDAHRFADQLRHQGFHDQLTGLPNRALFGDRLSQCLARGTHGPGGPALLSLDLDDFKAVNDAGGHAHGDLVLREVANRLSAVVRDQDTVARLGGDEFAVLLDDTSPGWEAGAVAGRLIAALAAIEGGRRVSVGVALVDEAGLAPADLQRDADTAMHTSKSTGGQRVSIFDPSTRAVLARRSVLRRDLRHAVERGELVVHYQPTIELRTGRVRGVEALVRWQHPALGLLPPLEFIGLAEDTGDIVEIGRWVLREACAQRRRWQLAGTVPPWMTMAVNVSARQLQAGVLVDDVRGALDVAVLEPSLLVVEVTESQLLAGDVGIPQLEQLREMGVTIAVDDFGTGYSSLSYLQQLPVDVLKIDRSFVHAMASSTESLRLVESIIAMARALGLDVVAEGVEDADQLLALRELTCPVGQGYLWGRPMPPHLLTLRLEALAADETTRRPARTPRAVRGGSSLAAVVPPLA